VAASCAGNEKTVAGGAYWLIPNTNASTAADVELGSSMPTLGTAGLNHATGWRASGHNNAANDRVLRAFAICVPKRV
jgi:hypothetical protein